MSGNEAININVSRVIEKGMEFFLIEKHFTNIEQMFCDIYMRGSCYE
jgi:hypothetical protein